MRQIENFFKKTLSDCLDDKHVFNAATVAVMSEQNIWNNTYLCGCIHLDGVTLYLAVGGYDAARYFKSDGQDYIVSSFIEKGDKCYTGRVLTAWDLKGLYSNVKSIAQSLIEYKVEDFESEYDDCMSTQKAFQGELASFIQVRENRLVEIDIVEEKVAADPDNALLIRILAIATREREDCYCTESQLKFKEIKALIETAKPELKQ